jgi:xylose isomerase
MSGNKAINNISFEGSQSTNPLAFKYHNSEEEILGKPMREHLKFSMAYWHTMTGIMHAINWSGYLPGLNQIRP